MADNAKHPSDANDLPLLDDSTTDNDKSIQSQASDDEAEQGDQGDNVNLEQGDQDDNMNPNNHRYYFGYEFYFQIKLMYILHNTHAPNYLY